jgi:hypothetical protein
MSTTGSNRRLVAKILVFSALVFFVLAALSWGGALPINTAARRLFAIAFTICGAADTLIGLVLWNTSQKS